ncbi:hypothetical protein B0H19DRAFT_1065450 [Mycena capillaripes]|nr:hypothetical protein B0H19DRAFT_1065450 [Mycena capillaripes]
MAWERFPDLLDDDNAKLNRQTEKALEEAKVKMALQVKLGTILKQMRLIRRVPFGAQHVLIHCCNRKANHSSKRLREPHPWSDASMPFPTRPSYTDVDPKTAMQCGGQGRRFKDDKEVEGGDGEWTRRREWGGIAADVDLIDASHSSESMHAWALRLYPQRRTKLH